MSLNKLNNNKKNHKSETKTDKKMQGSPLTWFGTVDVEIKSRHYHKGD